MAAAWPEAAVTVVVPASSANLGPGFDSVGLALTQYDRVTLEVVADGLTVEVDGEGADLVPRDQDHLVVRAARAAFDAMAARPPGLRLRCRNTVPHGRGLGSSAAAIVAGILAARALVARSRPAAALGQADVLRLASDLEGHADNVAAALLGGLTVAWAEPAGPRALRLEPALSVVALVSREPVSTELARGLLPEQVPHAAAAANSARAALLVAATTGRPDLLLPATEDRLHQHYREPAMPRSLRLVRALRRDGHAAVVSGAGPSVLVLCDRATVGSPPRAEVVKAIAAGAPGWRVLPLAVDLAGARVLD